MRTARKSNWVLVVPGVLALLLALGLVVMAALCSSSAVSQPVASSTTTPSKKIAATVKPSPSSNPSAMVVSMAPPERLDVASANIHGTVSEYTAAQAQANGGVLSPPTAESIVWYSGTGSMPGTNATSTTYIMGHSGTPPRYPAVFDNLRNIQVGDMATVTTANGVLTYKTTQVFTVAKDALSTDQTVEASVPGRLVLISCFRPTGYPAGVHATDNVVVILQLVS